MYIIYFMLAVSFYFILRIINFFEYFVDVQSLFSQIDSKACQCENSEEKQQSFRVSVRYKS